MNVIRLMPLLRSSDGEFMVFFYKYVAPLALERRRGALSTRVRGFKSLRDAIGIWREANKRPLGAPDLQAGGSGGKFQRYNGKPDLRKSGSFGNLPG